MKYEQDGSRSTTRTRDSRKFAKNYVALVEMHLQAASLCNELKGFREKVALRGKFYENVSCRYSSVYATVFSRKSKYRLNLKLSTNRIFRHRMQLKLLPRSTSQVKNEIAGERSFSVKVIYLCNRMFSCVLFYFKTNAFTLCFLLEKIFV